MSNWSELTQLNAEPILKRVRRKLGQLQPPMSMAWSRVHGGYVISDATGGRSWGPYGFEHLGALAVHVGALKRTERVENMLVRSLSGSVYPQFAKLPRALAFTVVTPALKAAIELLEAGGWGVQYPVTLGLISGRIKPEDKPVTEPVTPADEAEQD